MNLETKRPTELEELLIDAEADDDVVQHTPPVVALSQGNQILGGGGFGTRLMSEVREKRGLTYGVCPR